MLYRCLSFGKELELRTAMGTEEGHTRTKGRNGTVGPTKACPPRFLTLPCLPQVLAECVLCTSAWEPWLLQGCQGRWCRSAIPRRSACQSGQGPGQCGL